MISYKLIFKIHLDYFYRHKIIRGHICLQNGFKFSVYLCEGQAIFGDNLQNFFYMRFISITSLSYQALIMFRVLRQRNQIMAFEGH